MADLARTQVGLATYINLTGPLNDKVAIGDLAEAVESCLAARLVHLVLDFQKVTLINSAGLELLMDSQERLTRLGGGITVSNVRLVIRDVFRLTGLDHYLTLLDDEKRDRPARGTARATWNRLGDQLVERGLVSHEAVNEGVALQQKTGKRLGEILVDQGLLSEGALLEVLAETLSLPFVRLRAGVYDPDTLSLLGTEMAARLKVLPLFKVRDSLYLASSDPQDVPVFDAVEELTGTHVKPVLANPNDIREALSETAGGQGDLAEFMGKLDQRGDLELVETQGAQDYAAIDEMASGSPVINLVNGLIQRAVRDGASDIHIEPSRNQTRVRFRIDGMLYQVMTPPIQVHPALVSRLKVMANLDIAERRLPQDGRVQVYTQGRTIDLRFSSLPGLFGEKVVLRVLDRSLAIVELGQLGMLPDTLAAFQRQLKRSYGLILVTGPTGSGKTTTLYSAISHLNSIEKSIVTIEDPVEYQLDMINQNQVREKVGLTFARLLKHVLRQDPDIVMVGEIRERETAEIAVQAALTGHLVLSTLHTNDSVGAITRMLDMGVEPYLLSSALRAVMAQRLVRGVCPHCGTSYVAPHGSLGRFGIPDDRTVHLRRGRGCPQCYDSGYKGRLAIHEFLECDSDTQQLMIANPTREALREHLAVREIRTLLEAGVEQAVQGNTTIEEVTRVVNV